MTTLFFFGTLRFRPLLDAVLGHPVAPVEAMLPGYRTVWAKGESFPMLVQSADDRAEGVLLREVTETDLARLRYYEGAFSYDLVPVDVDGPDGREVAQVFMPKDAPWTPAAPWSLDDWARDWGEVTLIAAAEVMRAFGRESPEEVAARFPIIRARAQARTAAAARRRPQAISSSLSSTHVETTTHRIVYENFFALEEYEARFRNFDGGWSDTGPRAVFHVADAVTILPYDPIRDMVMLVEQMRMAPLAQGDPQPWLLEPVAGIVDAGESYEDTARREAREEAHLPLGTLHRVAGYYPSPGGIAQYLVSYVGTASLADARKQTGGIGAEGEDIRNILVPFDQLVSLLESGELVNAPLILSAQWLMLNRDRLRAAAATDLP